MMEKKKPENLDKVLAILKPLSEATKDNPISISRAASLGGGFTKGSKTIPFYPAKKILERTAGDSFGIPAFKTIPRVVEHGANKEIQYYPEDQHSMKKKFEEICQDPFIRNICTGTDLDKLDKE